MDKLPPTPPKSQLPSSSPLNSSPSSLPPRPPPTQIRSVISILPALPMAHHQKQVRKFVAQGIGRGSGLQGHSSLPPKPGIPGKPLPRDTGPIVLTGGKETTGSGSFSYSPVAKRTYSSTTMAKAESPPAARREPVMTELAPASKAKVATSPVHHHQPPVAPITPPAEAMTRPFVDQIPSSINYSTDTKEAGIQSGDQIPSSQQAKTELQSQDNNELVSLKTRADHAYPNTMRPEMVSQPNFLSFPHPAFYENIQENGFHPNKNLNTTNGNETPIQNGPLSDGYPPYALPHPLLPHHPHPHHMPFHHQGFIPRGPQDLYQFHSSMTPPNTGTMFAPPPPFRPHGTFDSSSQTSEKGGSTNPQTPFTPTHPFPVHMDMQHQHHMSVFSPPPHEHVVHFNNPSNEHHPQGDRAFENALIASQENKTRQTSIIESNPLLRNISFFPPDNDHQYNGMPTGNMIMPAELSSPGFNMGPHGIMHSDGNQNRQPNGFDPSMGRPHKSNFEVPDKGTAAAHRLQSYSLGYYLCDRLSDVKLSVNQTGGEYDWNAEEFNAHSFILGRSTKLARLIEDQVNNNDEQALEDSRDSGMWADQTEMGRKAKITSSRKITLSLKTNDKNINRDSFLLSLRWLYGAADWELDAYLDPSHSKHRTLEWTRASTEKAGDFRNVSTPDSINPSEGSIHQEINNSTESISLGNIMESSKSEEVQMLDRSIALLATGTLLGINEIIEKGAWGIRRWGMRLEGSALERLLDFALHANEEAEAKAFTNGINEPSAGYGAFAKNMLDEAIAFLVKNLPQPFKFDPRAPASKYLVRFSDAPNRSSTGVNTPISPLSRGFNGPAEIRQAYSTILLSVPFGLLRTILEHDGFGVRVNDWKGFEKYDIAKAVVHERERRRKYSFKVQRDRRLSICSDLGTADGHTSDSSISPALPSDKSPDHEDLHWEESVLRTFGHGGNGLEITRRKKGVGATAGGRVLWKVGDSTAKV